MHISHSRALVHVVHFGSESLRPNQRPRRPRQLLNRLKAIGSEATEFSVHESVLNRKKVHVWLHRCRQWNRSVWGYKVIKLNENSKLNSIPNLYTHLFSFVTYYGVPEVNSNRKCTVLPVIRSRITKGDPTTLLTNLSFELNYELICKGYESLLGPSQRIIHQSLSVVTRQRFNWIGVSAWKWTLDHSIGQFMRKCTSFGEIGMFYCTKLGKYLMIFWVETFR